MIHPWNDALDSVVAELLELAQVTEPPVDSITVAERLRGRVIVDPELRARACRKQLAGGLVSIVLAPDDRDERMYFAAAHELGEQFAVVVSERAGDIELGELNDRLREDLANRIASRLLCPNPWFRELAQESGFDLLYLRSIFSTASHEVIARRMLEFETPTAITIFDNGSISLRKANTGDRPRLAPIERELWARCHASGAQHSEERGGICVQAWPVHEDGWRREILRTSVREYD